MTNTAPFATIFIFNLAIILQLSFVSMPASAQEETRPKKGILEFGFGFSSLGPTSQMVKLMKEYNFDGNRMTFFRGEIKYPRYLWFGTAFHISYFRQIAGKSSLGIDFSTLERGSVKGYSYADVGDLRVRFSQGSIALLYWHQLENHLEFEAGPAIVFNNALTASNLDESQDYVKVSPGLKFGFNLVILERQKSNLKSDIKFIYSGSHNMGPFSSYGSYSGSITIPARSFRFNFIKLGLVYGFFL